MPAMDNTPATDLPLTPAVHAFAIVPADGADLAEVTRSLQCGTSGTAAVIFAKDSAPVTVQLNAGVVYDYRVKRVLATGTTALTIVGLV